MRAVLNDTGRSNLGRLSRSSLLSLDSVSLWQFHLLGGAQGVRRLDLRLRGWLADSQPSRWVLERSESGCNIATTTSTAVKRKFSRGVRQYYRVHSAPWPLQYYEEPEGWGLIASRVIEFCPATRRSTIWLKKQERKGAMACCAQNLGVGTVHSQLPRT
jgi:hypothetical protein